MQAGNVATRNCPQCGQDVAPRGGVLPNYCGICGQPLAVTQPPLYEAPLRRVRTDAHAVGIAYGLWALCLVGVAGIHRFYAGRYITGTIWLLTWGLLGIGLLVDLFLIPGMFGRRPRAVAAEWQMS